MSNNHRAIGIDLGTTNCSVGYFQHGRTIIIPNAEGDSITSSYVAFTDKERLIGTVAERRISLNLSNTVFDVYRLLGRKFDDPVVQTDMKRMSFKVVENDGKIKIQVEYKHETKLFTPEEILSMILSKMKEIAEAYLGEKVSGAVVAVPAHLNFKQRVAVRDAGCIAGLNIFWVVNSSTLSGVAYGFEKKVKDKRNVLVFDLGGRTLNISILKTEEGICEVKSTVGNADLGGVNFNHRLVSHFVSEFQRKHNQDLSQNKRALQRLLTGCEATKRTLSSSSQATIEIESLHEGIDFYSTITRARFEELCADLFRLTLEPVEKALRDAKMDRASVHEIVLTGGSTRIPAIQKVLQGFFNGKKLNRSMNPDEAVARGAAINAAIVAGNKSEGIKDLLLLDVTTHSLGIETSDDVTTTIIRRNTTIPTKETERMTTSHDNQQSLEIKVFEGERPKARDNLLLGQLHLSGTPPAFRGKPEIEVTFDLGAASRLDVSVLDKSSGKEMTMDITDKNRLSEEEIKPMIREAEKFQKDDQTRREYDATKQSLESFCVSTRAAVMDEKLHANEKKVLLKSIERVLEWMEMNEDAKKDEYEQKLRHIRTLCRSILRKISNINSEMPDNNYEDGVIAMESCSDDDD